MEKYDFRLKDGESEEQYLWRIGQAKDNGLLEMDWHEIADMMNKNFRTDDTEYMGEAAYRKPYQYTKKFYEAGVFENKGKDEYVDELRNAKHEIIKEKRKLYDERLALNKTLREQSRREGMYDIIKRGIEDWEPVRFEYEPKKTVQGDCDLIIHLTDVHCGVDIDSVFNKFNKDILQERIASYIDKIAEIKETHHAENAYVILGGDLIQGLIHTNSRVEAKENTVEQIMIVSDIIGNFLHELSKIFAMVEVHSVCGNHSRTVADKDSNVSNDNFDLLIPFACRKQLTNVKNVVFADKELTTDIAVFNVRGKEVYAAHGDKDSATSVVNNMTMFARKAGMPLPDICYLGHRHRNGLTTIGGVKVVESGCVDGMDSYAIRQRLTGNPEQTVAVVNERNGLECLYDVQLI